MKQMKMILLGLVMSVLPLSAVAEGDDAMMSETKDSQMLRVINIVPGYQALTVAGQEINATYLEETLGERHGAIVLLHDQGEQFESQGVITPLRHQMPQYGWSTLSLALDFPSETNILLSSSVEQGKDESTSPPKEGVSAESDQQSLPTISNQQRVEAAIALLQAKDIKRIVFIGHGMGGSLAVELLENIDTPIAALILVGTANLTMTEEFKTFDQPIFDIYGDNDFVGVEQAVKNRKTMMKRSGNRQYLIRKIDGADHVFSGLQTILVNTIRGWLTTTFLKQEDQ
ncbi:MAG: alpha/beta fold hydrolase [Piscirickettsiaceae bacterium]|nr:alpha/beta fold hydrolase [Piscirickettsiaceae bacterium]